MMPRIGISHKEIISGNSSNCQRVATFAVMSRSITAPALTGLSRALSRRASCRCASLLPSRTPKTSRTIATDNVHRDDAERYGNRGRELREGPRWASTPPRMKAPFRSKPPVANNDFQVNTDPKYLDSVYQRVLGTGGDEILTEEVKWLAVTHKSFDHGRRGYNDRLAFLGVGIQPCMLLMLLT